MSDNNGAGQVDVGEFVSRTPIAPTEKFNAAASAVEAMWADQPEDEVVEASQENTPEPQQEVAQEEPKKKSAASLEQARQLRALAAKEAEEQRLRKEYAELQKKITEYEEDFKDPLKALARSGTNYIDLTKKLAEGQLRPKSPQELELEELKRSNEELRNHYESMKKQAAEHEEQQKLRQIEEQELQVVMQTVEALSEEAPIAALDPHVGQRVRNAYYDALERGEEVDLETLVRKWNDSVIDDIAAIFENPKALSALKKHAKLSKYFAPEQPQTPTKKIIPGFSNTKASSVARRSTEGLSETDRMKRATNVIHRIWEEEGE